jgi:hypothetical protein
MRPHSKYCQILDQIGIQYSSEISAYADFWSWKINYKLAYYDLTCMCRFFGKNSPYIYAT